MKRLFFTLCFIAIVSTLFAAFLPGTVEAGIYNANSEVTYKEYWAPHAQYTGGIADVNTCSPSTSGNSYYIEPWPRDCRKTLVVNIPDDFSNALKIEVYLDLWRNQVTESANFKINNGSTVYAPEVGFDWSRTPWIAEIPKSEFVQGNNSFEFWQTGGGYHVHDLAVRVYYDDANPLVAGSPSSDVTPPDGALITVKGDNDPIGADAGGLLNMNSEQLTLTANVSGNAKLVEFHGYYYGYDEDNDGNFTDWHNRGHVNWFPGGTWVQSPDAGGTIDHLGTKRTSADGSYSVTYNAASIPDQTGVRFKIRIVDAAGNVREAAGGVSADFEIRRTNPVVAFVNSVFSDIVLRLNGKPLEVDSTLDLPAAITSFEASGKQGLVLNSFWRGPKTQINGNNSISPTFPNDSSNTSDYWQLSMSTFNVNYLAPGRNSFRYVSGTGGAGEFVEKPGPMVVVQRNSGAGTDIDAPEVYSYYPSKNAVIDDVNSLITAHIFDLGSGVNKSSIVMKVDGVTVNPSIEGTKYNYILKYQPSGTFEPGQTVNISVDGCDNDGRCMSTQSWSFSIYQDPVEFTLVSDDFNRCLFDDVAAWSFVNPLSDATLVTMAGQQAAISVPAGVAHEFDSGINVPRIMQTVNDTDFEMDVKFDSVFTADRQIQGILIQESATSFLQLRIQANVPASGDPSIDIEAWEHDGNSVRKRRNASISMTAPLYMRVSRVGVTWRIFYSTTGEENSWVKLQFDHPLTVSSIGVFVGNGGASPAAFTGKIDYVFNNASPISPEDGNALFLPPVQIVGSGTVTQNPDCGEPVELTATADAGWRFAGWSGDLSGTTNPATIASVSGTESITATFTQVFTLDVSSIGNGSVAISPEQADYLAGDQVTLTATPAPGYIFTGWSGDATGTTTPLIVTMDANKSIVATFVQPYSLDVVTVGNGTITKTPDLLEYMSDDVVTLTATADTGWSFVGWSGALSGSATTQNVTISGNMVITGTFKAIRSLDVTINGDGTVGKSPDQESYLDGDVVTLTAVPAEGWAFVGWSGDLTTTENVTTITLDANKSVSANFKQLFALTITANGSGTVSQNPNQPSYIDGTQVAIEAIAADGWEFVGWDGDLTGAVNPTTVTMDSAKNIQAIFKQKFVLQVNSLGSGSVTIEPEKDYYLDGEFVQLTATPAAGWAFTGWSGNLSGRSTPISVQMDSDKIITADFKPGLGLTVNIVGQGTVQLNPDKPIYENGEKVTLTATPAAGWSFDKWSGDASGTTVTVEITIDSNKSVTANFNELLSLTMNVVGEGSVTIDPDKETYENGEQVTLSATPATGWEFVGWSGDLTAGNSTTTVIMNSAMNVTATFRRIVVQVNVSVLGAGEGGVVTVEPLQDTYYYGDEITLTAVANPGYVFSGWEDLISSADNTNVELLVENPLVITLTGDVNYQASFTKVAQQIFIPIVAR